MFWKECGRSPNQKCFNEGNRIQNLSDIKWWIDNWEGVLFRGAVERERTDWWIKYKDLDIAAEKKHGKVCQILDSGKYNNNWYHYWKVTVCCMQLIVPSRLIYSQNNIIYWGSKISIKSPCVKELISWGVRNDVCLSSVLNLNTTFSWHKRGGERHGFWMNPVCDSCL